MSSGSIRNNYPYPGEDTFPTDKLFAMLHSIARMYRPGETDCKDVDPWACLLKAIFILLPNSRVKKVWGLYLESEPYPHMDPVGWMYKLHKKIANEVYEKKFVSRIRFDEIYSPQNMNITTWSHPTWFMIHYLAIRVRDRQMAIVYKSFISCLQFLLPCPKCRNHLRENLKSLPIDNAPDLYTWSCDLHNHVNRQLGKEVVDCYQVKNLYL